MNIPNNRRKNKGKERHRYYRNLHVEVGITRYEIVTWDQKKNKDPVVKKQTNKQINK